VLSESLWIRLPVELIREILLFLAETSMKKARELRLVCSDVNILVLPVLFRHVYLVNYDQVFYLASTLLPKRRDYEIPALKSKLHVLPRNLSSYSVKTWAFIINERRPSIETALSSIAPVFVGLSKLAITGQNLSSNAFWLREHFIHPTVMLLVHFGSPHLVNFYDSVFQRVTHLYTSITHGHRYSTIKDIPHLTHLAVSSRANLHDTTARNLAKSLLQILKTCENLVLFVFMLEFPNDTYDDRTYFQWKLWLFKCLQDKRFILCADFRPPRIEWSDIANDRPTLWDRALIWRKNEDAPPTPNKPIHEDQLRESRSLKASFPPVRRRKEDEWEIDLVQRDSFNVHTDDPDLQDLPGFVSAFGWLCLYRRSCFLCLFCFPSLMLSCWIDFLSFLVTYRLRQWY